MLVILQRVDLSHPDIHTHKCVIWTRPYLLRKLAPGRPIPHKRFVEGINIGSRELRRILAAHELLAEAGTTREFARGLVTAAASLIPSDVLGVYLKSPSGKVECCAVNEMTLTVDELQEAGRLWATHPISRRYLEGLRPGVNRLSDFASDREWRSHPMFGLLHRDPAYLRHLSVPLRFGRLVTDVLSLHRSGRDFSDREMQIARLFVPMAARLWRLMREKQMNLSRMESLPPDPQERHFRLRSLGLTRRESEILGWILEGKQNREIGIILGISFRTVQKHVERMLARLGLENRHALAIHALRWQEGNQ